MRSCLLQVPFGKAHIDAFLTAALLIQRQLIQGAAVRTPVNTKDIRTLHDKNLLRMKNMSTMKSIFSLYMEIITFIISLVKQYGGNIMIVFDKLWITMKNKGVTTYTLREKHGMDTRTIKRLRTNMNTTTDTLAKLCIILDCKLEDIAEFRKD